MRNQRQSFYRSKLVLHLFAFAVLMVASMQLLAANTVNPPGGTQKTQPHFKFVVPVSLSNLGTGAKSLFVMCQVMPVSSGNPVGIGKTDIPIDATRKVVTTVTVPIHLTNSNLQYLSEPLKWVCDVWGVPVEGGQPTIFMVKTNVVGTNFGYLRSGSPTADGGFLRSYGTIQ